jgi:tetratricopeptide (TPR) repeat protein
VTFLSAFLSMNTGRWRSGRALRSFSLWGVLALIMVLPWCLGGAFEWTTPLLLAGAAVAALLAALAMRADAFSFAATLLLVLLLVPLVVALLQLIPLPDAVLLVVSPRAQAVREFVVEPLGSTAWAPVSLDARATARAMSRGLALLLLAFATVRVLNSPAAFERLMLASTLQGAALSLCGLTHWLLQAERLFGVYRFQANNAVLTPFGNKNHLAAFLILTTASTVAFILLTKKPWLRLLGLVSAGLQGTVVLLSLSRGGVLFWGLLWLCMATLLASRRWLTNRRRNAFAPWMLLGAMLFVAVLVAQGPLQERWATMNSLEKLSVTKIGEWPMFAAAAKSFWPLGMGLGTFEVAFGAFQTESFDVTMTHPENFFLQWLNEVGVFATLLLTGGFALLWLRCFRDAQRSSVRVVLLGLAAVALHDSIDFALELNAVTPAALVAFAAVATGTRRRTPTAAPASRRKWATAVVASTLLGAAAYAAGLPTHLDDEARVTALLESSDTSAESLGAAAMLRHPSDWVIAAMRARAAKDPRNSLAWVNRWLFLRPQDSAAHGMAATALFRLNRPVQAFGELRLAFEAKDYRALPLGLAIAQRQHSYAPLFVDSAAFVEAAANELSAQPTEVERWLRQVIAAELSTPTLGHAQLLLTEFLLNAGRGTEARTVFDAMAVEQPLAVRAPNVELLTGDSERLAVRKDLLGARVLLATGEAESAIALLTALRVKHPENLTIGLALVDAHQATSQAPLAAQTIDSLLPLVSLSERAQLFERKAALFESEGDFREALELRLRASRMQAATASSLYKLAALHERLGAFRLALEALRRGRALDSPQGAAAQNDWEMRLVALTK